MFIPTSYMSSMPPYEVVRFDEAKDVYRQLTADYWNWIYEEDCDNKFDRGYVTFLRDDILGGERKTGDPPFKKSIKIPQGSSIFFPVYHVHICERDPHPDGAPCGNIDRCVEAAYEDLGKLEPNGMYAEIAINKGVRKPITNNLGNHKVTLAPFTLKVPRNNLTREPDYHLNPGIYDGVVRGTYMFLKNFQNGTYFLYFGGVASNYFTHSEYTVQVI